MNVLITNDDGLTSEGLKVLADFLSKRHRVIVLAPDGNRSGCSHSLSFYKDLKFNKAFLSENYESYTLSGSPADCVKFAVHNFKDIKFDMVCTGINHGNNLGSDTNYSGTVSAGLEANFFGIPAIAFSNVGFFDLDFKSNLEFLENYFDKLFESACKDYALNVNMPNGKAKGIKVVPLGINLYSDGYEKSDEGFFRLVGEPLKPCGKNETDVLMSSKGYATVTPILYDRTDYASINKIKENLK